jgi:DUF4097 and DUF4098 domain-containing protein YvlB
MPTYPTAQSITATIQLASGDVLIEASDRDDTVVDVTPTNASHEPDIAAAEQTRIELSEGRLRIVTPRNRGVGLLRKTGSVQVVVKLPSASSVDAATGLGRIRTAGRLGECHIRSGAGGIDVSDAASIDLVTGLGAISAGHVSGNAVCVTGSGAVRVAQVGGSARVKNSNGDTWLGDVGTAVKVKASNGSVWIDRARGDVSAATANGDLLIGSTERGTVDVRTALGTIELGVAAGTAARLDLHTSFGSVVNDLEPTDRPRPDEATVTMIAQTSAGDIVIRRAPDLVG